MTRLPLLPGQENWACTVPFCWAPAECRIEDGGVAGRPVCDFHAYEKMKGAKMADEPTVPDGFDAMTVPEMTAEMDKRLPSVADQLIERFTELADRLESGERVHAQEIPWDAADFWDSVHDHLTLDHGVQPADAARWIDDFRSGPMIAACGSPHGVPHGTPADVALAVLESAKAKAVADGIDPPTLWACDGCGRALTPAGEHRWVCENAACPIQTVSW